MITSDRFFYEIKFTSQTWIKEAFNSVEDKNLTTENKAIAIRNYLIRSARQQQENIKQELLNKSNYSGSSDNL